MESREFEFGLIPISPRTICPDVPIAVDVFVWPTGESQPTLFLAKEQVIAGSSTEEVLESPDIRLFIDCRYKDVYQSYLRDQLPNLLNNEHLDSTAKTAILSEVVRDVLSHDFGSNDASMIVENSHALGKHMTDLLANFQLTGVELGQVLHHDYGTFTHSANVGFYSGLIAAGLGFREEELSEIVVGGLLHDIGKLDIDERILNKPGKLDDLEFRKIKTHPLVGFRRLTAVANVSRVHLLMTYQHHERLDGRGYPVGIERDEIDIAAKICTVADVYEALTSNRPYRSALKPSRAIEIMKADVGKAFDEEVFRCFLANLINR